MNREHIFLLIDDDEDDRELFQMAISEVKTRSRCYTVPDCMQALISLNSALIKPDYIFLDLNMPRMDGKECLCELKRHPDLKKIPVVIFSTSSEQHHIQETRSLGAIEFITKPSKISELSKVLEDFLQRRHVISQLQK